MPGLSTFTFHASNTSNAGNTGNTGPVFHCQCLPVRYRVVQLRPDLLYLAVFDGHGGSLCAEYCEEHFERHILHHLDREEDMLVVLDKSFHDVNRSFERWYTSKKKHLGRASSSGSTATIGLLQVKKLKIFCIKFWSGQLHTALGSLWRFKSYPMQVFLRYCCIGDCS